MRKIPRYIIAPALILGFLIAFARTAECALLWKDEFNDNLIYELTWDTKHTTGTPHLQDGFCVLNTGGDKKQLHQAIGTLPARALPSDFDLLSVIEFTTVENKCGEFYVRIGACFELVVTFDRAAPKTAKKAEPGGIIYVHDAVTKKRLSQTNGTPAQFTHNISSGERYYLTWMSNGDTPALQSIKFGSNPGESNIAHFIIGSKSPPSGRVEVGIQGGLGEVRLDYVRAYLYGTSAAKVHDWVLY